MSLSAHEFMNEPYDVIFLGGVLSLLNDELNLSMYSKENAFDYATDLTVFYLGENNEFSFEKSVKKRMTNHWYGTEDNLTDEQRNLLIEKMTINLTELKDITISDCFLKCFGINENDYDYEKVKSASKKFEDIINYYFISQRDKQYKIYHIGRENNYDLYDWQSLFCRCYYAQFDMYVIELNEYAIFMSLGTAL